MDLVLVHSILSIHQVSGMGSKAHQPISNLLNSSTYIAPSKPSAKKLQVLSTDDQLHSLTDFMFQIVGFTVADAISLVGQAWQNLQRLYGKNRDFDAW